MEATLDVVRSALGTISNVNNGNLQFAFDTAKAYVTDEVYPERLGDVECQYAIVLGTNRLYKRFQSPEGVAGWGDLGVIRIISTDPDITRLLEHKIDMTDAGVA